MGKISLKEGIALNQNFVNTRSAAIDKAIGKKDALSSWFSIEELKEYINYVEKEGEAKGININGIRVYFGAYSKNIKNEEKNNLSTVFLVPTKLDRQGEMQKDGLKSSENPDVEDIDGLNDGGLGNPPSSTYPQ
ncbi:hypothetical protein [Lutibacter citreus]|uniref:hypothetical protein n=1 Tax=Lutibacter citreus TaxID=2138210 RepID=UPI000DBEA845|nr:hypothetical protein [Lutibacter citreus]